MEYFKPSLEESKIIIVNSIPETDRIIIQENVNIIRNKQNAPDLIYQAQGGFGHGYRFKNYFIKIFTHTPQNDGSYLSLLQHIEGYPKLYLYSKVYMVTEFIQGSTVLGMFDPKNWDVRASTDWKEIIENGYKKSLSVNLIPDDISSQNVILEGKTGKPFIIDVGRYVETDSITAQSILNAYELRLKPEIERIFSCYEDALRGLEHYQSLGINSSNYKEMNI